MRLLLSQLQPDELGIVGFFCTVAITRMWRQNGTFPEICFARIVTPQIPNTSALFFVMPAKFQAKFPDPGSVARSCLAIGAGTFSS